MQTFLPLPNIYASVRALDDKRLGKQRSEAKQILDILLGYTKGKGKGWRNHPAVALWRGYEWALARYYNAVLDEWERRGFRNNMLRIRLGDVRRHKPDTKPFPPFIGHEDFHRRHRSNLIRKDPEYYGNNGWKEPDNLPYIWKLEEE